MNRLLSAFCGAPSPPVSPGRRAGFRAELSEQPGAAGAESLCRTAAGRRQGEGVARGDARTAAFGRHGPHGRFLHLGRCDGAATAGAMATAPCGSAARTDRWDAAAGLAARRRGAQGEGPAVDRVDSAKSARGRLFRPGRRLSGEPTSSGTIRPTGGRGWWC